VPIQTGALDGIMTFKGISKNFNNNAKDIVNRLENMKLIKRNFILFSLLIGKAWGAISWCGGILIILQFYFEFHMNVESITSI